MAMDLNSSKQKFLLSHSAGGKGTSLSLSHWLRFAISYCYTFNYVLLQSSMLNYVKNALHLVADGLYNISYISYFDTQISQLLESFL